MHLNILANISLVAASVVVGWLGWSGEALLLPVVLAFPLLWSAAQTRLAAAFVSAGYFLAASRDLPQGVANYYASDLWPGLLMWLAASLAFVIVLTVLWTNRPGPVRALRYLLACLLMAVPPFGIMGWAHPFTTAGILFPEWGWSGLVATAAGLAFMTTRWWPAAAIVMGVLWLWSGATWTEPTIANGWRGVELEMGASLGRDPTLERQRDLIARVHSASRDGADVVVLPESAIGYWTPTVERIWREGLRNTKVTVVAGAAKLDPIGYDNIVVSVSDARSTILYRERMPVPISMWQPWRRWLGQSGGAQAHFLANSPVAVDGQTIAPLICYEQLIVWPVLQSMMHDPDVLLAIGNGWWTNGTSIIAIQRASTIAWARLFAKPLVISVNR